MSEEYNKKVVYAENDKVHADLRLRLHYDGISQSDFFRGCVRAYLGEEGAFMTFLGALKERRTKLSSRVRKIATMDEASAKKQQEQFGLAAADVEDIFDILEKEHENL
ncbi:MAG TPA: hypothetical protein EYN67_04025 [Flavobacteriales bacterium]|jgi:hypothetical protein|nr:hypothetical protein [Flavobacteriales bacterium]